MQLITLAVALFGTLAAARKHHNCGCAVRGSYNVQLSQATCDLWGQTQPNTHFDGHSCVDKGYDRGIDGEPWQKTCQVAWQIDFGGNPGDAVGDCWH